MSLRSLGASLRLAVLAVALLGGGCGYLADYVDRDANQVHGGGASPPPGVLPFHRQLLVADLHADTMLWPRSIVTEQDHGHVDLPRLRRGNVALQAFTVVTKYPLTDDTTSYDADSINLVGLLSFFEGWPIDTWFSLKDRALYQAEKLKHFAAEDDKLVLIETKRDLQRFLDARQADHALVGGFLGLEGAHALEGRVDSVDELFAAGFRMMSPTHHFNNDIGGSNTGLDKTVGLTPLGKEVIQRMFDLNIVVDLAHASGQTIDDVLDIARKPENAGKAVVVSHTGVQGVTPIPRNLTDRQIQAIAQLGGLVGIGYWDAIYCFQDQADCHASAAKIVDAMAHVVALDGVSADNVALGSDFDGSTTTPFDTAGLAAITAELKSRPSVFSDQDIRKIMGENVIRLLLASLPD